MIDADLGARKVSKRSLYAAAAIIGIGIEAVRKERSSGGGTHWIVTVDRQLTPIEALSCQMAMGDDLKRSTMNLGRVMSGDIAGLPWNLLYSEKIYLKKGVLKNGEIKKG